MGSSAKKVKTESPSDTTPTKGPEAAAPSPNTAGIGRNDAAPAKVLSQTLINLDENEVKAMSELGYDRAAMVAEALAIEGKIRELKEGEAKRRQVKAAKILARDKKRQEEKEATRQAGQGNV